MHGARHACRHVESMAWAEARPGRRATLAPQSHDPRKHCAVGFRGCEQMPSAVNKIANGARSAFRITGGSYMKTILSILVGSILLVGLTAFGQTGTQPPQCPRQGECQGQCQRAGCDGVCDKDGDGLCDVTGKPIGECQGPGQGQGQGQGRGRMGGPRDGSGNGRNAACPRASNPSSGQPAGK